MSQSHILPEWAPCKGVLLAWPYPGSDWDANYEEVVECYWRMLDAIGQFAEVWVLHHPTAAIDEFERKLSQYQTRFPVKVKHDVDFNDTWIRDFGPISCSDSVVSFTFNGWGGKYNARADNAVGKQLEDWLGVQPKELSFVCEGGGLEVNDDLVLLANEDCLIDPARNALTSKESVQGKLRDALAIREFAWLHDICLSGDDTDGHIDTIARFGPKNVLLYAGRNPIHHDSAVLESLHTQVESLAARWGWRLIELPTPIIKSRVDGRFLPATYTNFLICNNAVLQPVYGVEEDDLALAAVANAFAGFEIVPVHCTALVEQHGSLHCATMQVAFNSAH